MFHLDISGNSFKEEQLKNKALISIILFVFHFEISGREIKEEHS